jgi:isopropylmalate/homocitrate/citramalate synthase
VYDIERLKKQRSFKEGEYWASPLNFMGDNNMGLDGRSIKIHDVTLRDGEQTSNLAFSMADRLRIAEALNELGVARIEAGMPIISEEVRQGIRQMVDMNLDSEVVGFCRTDRIDVDLAEHCGVKSVIVEHIMNPYLIQQAYGIDKQQVIDNCIDVVSYAQEKGLKTTFMGWDLTRADDFDYLEDVYTQIFNACSPESIVLVDTLGCALPRSAGYLVKQFKEWLPDAVLEYHNHNEFGVANAGMLEAVAAGADVVHTSVNGLGERTGNASTEEVVVMLEVLAGVDTGVNLNKIMDTSILLENITNQRIPTNKPIVGRGLFNSESGIGVDIMRKLDSIGFEVPEVTGAFASSLVGQPDGQPVLGKNSGRSTIAHFLEKHGLEATKEQMGEITDRVKTEGRIQRKLLSDTQFLAICEKVL